MTVATFFRNIILSLNKSHSISSSYSQNIHLFIWGQKIKIRKIVDEIVEQIVEELEHIYHYSEK